MLKFLRLSLAALLLFVMSALAVMAQSTVTGAISGVITNPNKEVVPGAAITVRNVGTNNEQTATSDDEGRFRVVNLQPGTYSVTVNSQGFAPFTQEKVVVEVGQVTTLDVPLSLTGVSGTVEVSSEAPVLNTERQDFAQNINQTSINELPINGRRWSNFALLTPGTTPDGAFGLISFRGISGLLNNNTVDGGDNNQAFFSEERGRTRISYVVSQASIREFQVNTSNYSAEYGRAAGGVVNAVTKSGTNEFHGQLFYYQRNNKWGARNPLAFQPVLVNGIADRIAIKPEDVRHQFGGNIGGPIVKNKLFFFFNYDQQKRNFPGLGVFNNANFLNTINTATTAGTTLASQQAFDNSLKNPRRNLSDAQIASAIGFLNSLTGPVPRRGDQKIFLPKVDWNINQNHTFTASYNRMRWASPAGVQTQATNTRGRASFGDDFVNVDSLNMRLASTLSQTLVNELRFQWGRDNEFQLSQAPLPGEPTTAFGGTRSPDVFITGGIEFGTPTFLERRAFPDERRRQIADTVTLSAGNHTFKWGGDVNFVKDIQDNLRNEAGAYSYNNINDFIIDYVNFLTPLAANVPCVTTNSTRSTLNGTVPAATRFRGRCYTSNYNQGFGPTRFQFNTTDVAFFVQDDWRATPRLTLNLGLRYEYERLPEPFLGNNVLPQTMSLPDDRNNIGPRVGFAYDLTGDSKTSLRGGYGVYYGRIINSTILNALTNTGNPFGQTQSSVSGASSAAPIFPNVLPSAPAGAAQVQYFARNYASPQIHQMDFIIEREISRNTVVSASYLFSNGRRLPYFVDVNLNPVTTFRNFNVVDGPFAGQTLTIPFFTGARPIAGYNAITEIRSTVFSKYNALVLQANRRLTDGLQFQVNYTLSRASDTGQGSVTFTNTNDPFNAFDQGGENGLSNFDRRHKFTASVVYNTHFFSQGDSSIGRAIFDGWTISPIFNGLSGQRYTATISGSAPAAFGTPTQSSLNGSGGSSRFTLLPRNAFKMPAIINTDLRVSRRFRFTETANVEVLGEVFNLFNRTQVTNVDNLIYTVSGTNLTYRSTFGSFTEAGGTLFRERQVQFAVRFEF